MPTSDVEYRELRPHRIVDLVVNRLFQVGLDLHQALALAGSQHDPQARQRIRVAIDRIDETIDDVRHAVMPGPGPR